MKTLTLYATNMLLYGGGVYDRTSERVYVYGDRRLYIEFEQIPDVMRTRVPTSIVLALYMGLTGQSPDCNVFRLDGQMSIDDGVVPTTVDMYLVDEYHPTASTGWKGVTATRNRPPFEKSNGLRFSAPGVWTRGAYGYTYVPNETLFVDTPRSEHTAYITMSYDEGYIVTTGLQPVGMIDRTQAQTFSWSSTYSGFPIGTPTQTSASFQWKDGESGGLHSVAISGSAASYTMPANTLPESEAIYWRVQVTTTEGDAVSDWVSVRTVDTPAVATPISPSGSYVDGSQTAHFVWSYQTESGSAQRGYDLQVKGPTDADYITIKSETTANAYADVAAGSLPGGAVQWRVRAYNQSGVAGEWSAPLSCVVIGAPGKPSVRVEDASPRPTIAWTSSGQNAFRVTAEGWYDSGTVFGTQKSFKIPEYLENDIYEIKVYILGEYGLWSEPGLTYATVINPASGSCTLTAQAVDGDAQLVWDAVEDALAYQILRGGKPIAETTGTVYVDRYAIGDVSYRIRAVMASDGYVLSNAASVALAVRSPRITALDGEWIELDMYTSPLPTTQITATRDVALMQYAGVDYPVPEVSPHRTRTWVAYPAFRDPAHAAAFEQLLGRRVFVKDQYGTSLLGVMSSVQRSAQTFYTTLTAVVQEIGGIDL